MQMRNLMETVPLHGRAKIDFFKNALKAIVEARRALVWTYPYGYYLVHTPKRNFYEQYQFDLQMTLEKIGKNLVSKLRQEKKHLPSIRGV